MARELKINNKSEYTTKLGGNFLVSAGKAGTANKPQNIDLVLKLADDNTEVRGFGQPITPDLARDISLEFINKSEEAWKLIQGIKDGDISDIKKVKKSKGFKALLNLLHPDKQVVSGVFGKEAILQIIALKDCEGLRYVIGEIEGKTTIVLTGVRDVTQKGASMATSAPLAGWKYYQKGEFNPAMPPDLEVHQNSLTRSELLKTLRKEGTPKDKKDGIIQVLFGEY